MTKSAIKPPVRSQTMFDTTEKSSAAHGSPSHPTIPPKWNSVLPLRHPLPRPKDSAAWDGCYKCVHDYDEDMCQVWKEEIDKLLIFAGLFSAAVTAFTIESYQWLQDPRDINTALLGQLVMLQLNATGSHSSSSSESGPLLQLTQPFQPSLSEIRINIFWFTSLSLSLGSVLIGILSLQWLREYQRPVSIASFKDKLTYRQIRYEGLIYWKIPQIISTLPMLLQTSLILFFAGIFDLLWDRNHTVAKFFLVPTALITLVLAVSTILPAVQIATLRFSPDSAEVLRQCPYKSPQSWLICRIIFPVLDAQWFWKLLEISEWTKPTTYTNSQGSWFTLDQFWDDRIPAVPHSRQWQRWLTKALIWMQDNLTHNSDATYHLYQCLSDLDKSTIKAVITSDNKHRIDHDHSTMIAAGDDLDKLVYHEIASAIFLTTFHNHGLGSLEHWIRAANQKADLFTSIPLEELKAVPKDKQDEFYCQVLICGHSFIEFKPDSSEIVRVLEMLRIVGSAEMSPTCSLLLQLNLTAVKKWFAAPDAKAVQWHKHKELGHWLNTWGVGILNVTESGSTKALFLDLAWKVTKDYFAGGAGTYWPPPAESFRGIFRIASWDEIFSTPESTLWWHSNLTDYKPHNTVASAGPSQRSKAVIGLADEH